MWFTRGENCINAPYGVYLLPGSIKKFVIRYSWFRGSPEIIHQITNNKQQITKKSNKSLYS